MIHPRIGEVHELNPSASLLWSLADGTRELEEIARELSERFDVEPSVAAADTREFFAALEERGLITTAG